MSINKNRPHILILPEDDANRQLANGFVLSINATQIQILKEAGGWVHVCDEFVSEHIEKMRKYESRFVVLLLDFDNDKNRLNRVQNRIPEDLADRVFVLGSLTDPEALKRAKLGSYENIGKGMAKDCCSGTQTIWAHELLQHNKDQLSRLCEVASDILF